MAKFSYDIIIDAPSEKEADAKSLAVGTIVRKLNTRELLKLADIIENDPIKTALAKKALGV